MPTFARVLLFALAIPALGYLVSFFIIRDITNDVGRDVVLFCQNAAMSGQRTSTDIQEACREVANIHLLGRASLATGALTASIPLLYLLGAWFAGTSRPRVASVFPWLLRGSLVLIAVSVAAQGAIFTYGAFVGESYAIGRVHLVLIGAIGLGALLGSMRLIGVAMQFRSPSRLTVAGKVLTPGEAPRLFSLVQSLAMKLGATEPKNIVVGLEPTFYVTNSDIALVNVDTPLTGETLFLSAPLCRLLSQEELASVVGHELGHFRGEDTLYSVRFAPVYAGLGRALHTLIPADDDGISALAKMPAIAMLSFMHDVFATNVATISRERELQADLAATQAGSAMSFSTALAKVALYSQFWTYARRQNIERLNRGKITVNLSTVFQDIARYDIRHSSLDEMLDATFKQVISHPTDSHPPVSVRLAALGVTRDHVTSHALTVPPEAAIDLLDNVQQLEEDLTVLEHKLVMASGLAQLPQSEPQKSLLDVLYVFAGAIVNADGRIQAEEIDTAEDIGRQLFDDFDSVDFRHCCNNPSQLPNPVELAQRMRTALDDRQKETIVNYLTRIAAADGGTSEREIALLAELTSAFGIANSPVQ